MRSRARQFADLQIEQAAIGGGAAAAACFAMTFMNVGVSPAQDGTSAPNATRAAWSTADAQSAGADLSHASDFRVRVSAALYLGRNKPPGALDALVRAHRPRILRFLLASLRDREAAENLTQDCFVRAYKARAHFRQSTIRSIHGKKRYLSILAHRRMERSAYLLSLRHGRGILIRFRPPPSSS